MKKPDYPPYQGYAPYAPYPPNGNGYGPNGAPANGQYRQQNSTTHFVTGILAGAAVAYLLSNKKVQQGIANTGTKAWSTLRGEVEELKERLEDTKAELDYYRQRAQEK